LNGLTIARYFYDAAVARDVSGVFCGGFYWADQLLDLAGGKVHFSFDFEQQASGVATREAHFLQGGGLLEYRREGTCEAGGFLQGRLNRCADLVAQCVANGGGLERLAQRAIGFDASGGRAS